MGTTFAQPGTLDLGAIQPGTSPLTQPGDPGYQAPSPAQAPGSLAAPPPTTGAPPNPQAAVQAQIQAMLDADPKVADAKRQRDDAVTKIKATQDERDALIKQFKAETDPNALYKYLPNNGVVKPSDALKDFSYNFAQLNLRNPTYGSLRGEPYKPIELQRLDMARTMQQDRLKAMMDQLGANAQQDVSNRPLLTDAQAQYTSASKEAIAQGQQNQAAQKQAEQEKQDAILDRLKQAAQDVSEKKVGSEVTLNIAKAATVGKLPAYNAWQDYDKRHGGDGSPQRYSNLLDFVKDFDPNFALKTAPRITTSVLDAQGNPTTTRTIAMPGGSSAPIPVTATSKAAPTPTTGSNPLPVVYDSTNRNYNPKAVIATTPYDPNNAVDRMALAWAQDAKNKPPFARGPNGQREVWNRMAELGIQANNAPNDARVRSVAAGAALEGLDRIQTRIDQAQKDGTIGVLTSKINRFMTNEAGYDPSQLKEYSGLATDLTFLVSNAAMMHGGQRAAASPDNIKKWNKALSADDPDTMRSQLAAMKNWAVHYSKLVGSLADVKNSAGQLLNPSATTAPGTALAPGVTAPPPNPIQQQESVVKKSLIDKWK